MCDLANNAVNKSYPETKVNAIWVKLIKAYVLVTEASTATAFYKA